MALVAAEPTGKIVDFQAHARRRRFEREIGETVPPLASDLQVLRHSRDALELVPALERAVGLGPKSLDLEPLLNDAAMMLVAHYAGVLGPWSRAVRLRPNADLPTVLRTLPRIAAVLPLLTGRSVASVLRESPLSPLETCAVLGLLQRQRVLWLGEDRDDLGAPDVLDLLFRPRTLDPVYQSQHLLAAALRALQWSAAHENTAYGAWAKCAFTRAAAPMPDPLAAAALVVLVDELETPGCLQVRNELWDSGEVLARGLEGHVFQVPAGVVELTLIPYVGRVARWVFECGRDQVKLVRLSKRWRGWTAEETSC